MAQRISDAIIVHGPGRSGTTLLYNMLALHPELAWISGYVNRFPRHPILSNLNRLQGIRALEKWSRGRRFWPRPAEAYGFWNEYFPGFSAAASRPSEGHAGDRPDACLRAMRAVMAYSGKPRFITKITGLSRAAELERAFANPFVLYLNRDPRAVVLSMYKERWGYRSHPERFAGRETHRLLEEYVTRYRGYLEDAGKLERFRFMSLRYENLIDNPASVISRILAFTRLPGDEKFDKIITSWSIHRDANEALMRHSSPEELAHLNTLLADELAQYGYTSGEGC
jgi:hypothetical protein